MRLDLIRHNCVHFYLTGEVEVTRAQMSEVQDFMSQTLVQHFDSADSPNDLQVAVFGTRSKMRDGIYSILGSLARSSDENDLIVRFAMAYNIASDGFPSPPRSVRPVSVLVDNVSQLLGLFSVNCESVFEYRLSDGYNSKIQFPLPLLLPDATGGITHIESAEFSSRSDEGIRHKVSVVPHPEEDTVEHVINLDRDTPLNRTAIRTLFDENVLVSSRLVECLGEN